ncbi:sensor histidine kinase KdpD [Mucilaginibacter sp. UR6-11]|uniref:sensor histidine kinase n=1 Tax=Mucilaginibacter sp. UR6-11 TaxID=1435644 RepID=UPI001E50A1F3|nr:HAMP domain-containing sensor histidine kinase [Mucilaginibacter sp. UR6-11]MCC8426022.1 HAMP domain-containing histidine kinase [Mucilaginibacter sp. UR6-11]
MINISLRILTWSLPISVTKAQNFPEFDFTNWIYIILTPVFFLISHLLIGRIRKTKKATAGMIMFVFLFSFYIILCGMYSSFIVTSDPRNALTIYLIALCVISVMCVFEYDEVIVLLILTEVAFTAMLLYAHADATSMLYDQLISVVLLAGFYLISRYFFSYKASYYQQIIEIRSKNIEIEKAGEFKNQVLGMVAHDLRNPIGAVESIAMMIELDEIDEDMQENVNMIKESCAKARGILDDLLEAARNENINIVETEKTELNQYLKGIIEAWKIQNPIKIILTSAINPLYAQLNVEKFTRALDNLISNALKFSKETDQVELRLNQKDKLITIEVKDQGLGIPQDLVPHIFDRFSKAGRAGLKGEKSTGLGLSIVKQIIESHKGKISVNSVEGEGTTFLIQLQAGY